MSINKIGSSLVQRSTTTESGKPSPNKGLPKEENVRSSLSIDIAMEKLTGAAGETYLAIDDMKQYSEEPEEDILSQMRSQEIMARIASGFYETPEIINKIVERYVREHVLSNPA